jgi:predicted membrane-bound mannosyltransferase
MAFLTGKPTKAFIYQDHDAHIATHTSMLQDPMVMGQIGQNPMAQQMQGAIMAHIAEHVAFQYRVQLEKRLGATLPAPNTEMPEEVEVQLSKLVAQAATQLTQIHQGEAAQKQAQQQAQDPIVQMQQAELQIKQQETQIKAQKVQGELQLKAQELQLKAQEMQAKMGETPEMIAQRHQQELQQQMQRHQMELNQSQQVHQQKLSQAQQAAQAKAALQMSQRGE